MSKSPLPCAWVSLKELNKPAIYMLPVLAPTGFIEPPNSVYTVCSSVIPFSSSFLEYSFIVFLYLVVPILFIASSTAYAFCSSVNFKLGFHKDINRYE